MPKRASRSASVKKRPVQQVFMGKTLSLSGDFGQDMSYRDMARLITMHGGTFVKDVTDDTVILISTLDDFKKKSSQVRKALKLRRSCTIVGVKWLIDSLPQSNAKKRFMPPKKYALNEQLRVDPKKELVDRKLHDIYTDSTGFKYEVKLHRYENEVKAHHEKYTLYLFQSRAAPHTYMTGAKFNKGYTPTVFYRDIMCRPKTLQDALQDFKKLFKNKTGVPWEQRLEKREGRKETEFVFEVPKLGRPVGELPVEYIMPEEWKF
ncbi:hypothetical protein B7463_g1732, partial [Scytalidium lignicola]